MTASGWTVTLLLLSLSGSATSSPFPTYTPAPPLPSQISPPSPSPTIVPPSPSSSITPMVSSSGELSEGFSCPLMMSPSALVVRFGDPVKANCSIQSTGYSFLGWEVSLGPDNSVFQSTIYLSTALKIRVIIQPIVMKTPAPTVDHFLVWSVDSMTEWSIEPFCYALSEQGGQCHINLPILVYKPPDNVSISFVNHTGPMLEGQRYTLQCTVRDVAPVENLTATFYRGTTALQTQQSTKTAVRNKPVTEIFTFTITPSRNDDGVQYWCESKLELGPDGPLHPPVVMSQKITATVLYGPQFFCPAKLQLREGERLSCEVRGNPQPSVTWYREGQVVALPVRSSRKHAGKYTVLVKGFLESKNFTVEVEILCGSGTANSCDRHFLLAVLLIQLTNWL